jgi:hypothetical protein
VINHYQPHDSGGNAKEMGTVLPGHGLHRINEPNVSFIDQLSWLQSLVAAAAPKISPGDCV